MKINNIAALLIISTTAMMAETSSDTDEYVVDGTEGANTYYGMGAGDAGGGNYNSFFGRSAGYNNTGNNNTFSGDFSGNSNTIGSNNTFSGDLSGNSNTIGSSNTFSGSLSGYSNKEGHHNVFSGYESGYSNTTGGHNTFIGNWSGRYNTTGGSNVFSGTWSGYNNTTGIRNTFIGLQSGTNNKAGYRNTFIGYQSGFSSQTGNNNVFLGSYAGYSETGSNMLYIDNSDTNTPLIYGEFDHDLIRVNGTFETTDTIASTWVGSNTEGDGLTNLLALAAYNSDGDTSDAGFSLANGNYDAQWNFRTHQNGAAFVVTVAGTGGPEFTVKNATGDFKNVELYLGNGAKNVGGVWINASSRVLKENIKPLSTKEALTAFSKLQPVTYNYKTDKSEKVVGFIAEDVPELVSINSRDGLSSMDMVAVLTKVVQEQDKVMAETRAELKKAQEKIAKQDTKITKLETMQKRVAQLESILTNLALDTSNTKKEKVSIHLK